MNARRARTLGGAGQYWSAKRYDAYQHQLRTQAGPWEKRIPGHEVPLYRPLGDAGSDLTTKVAQVIAVFKAEGTDAGMTLARKLGVVEGAVVYVAARGDHEAELAARVAKCRVASRAHPGARVPLAFLEARLAEVRKAVREGATPDQAVADRPEVPRVGLPKKLVYLSFGLSLLAFARAAFPATGGSK